MKDFNATRVITMCSWKHSAVWKLTSSLVPKFINASEYFVYVPEKEIKSFKKITPSDYRIESQEGLGSEYRQTLWNKLILSNNKDRYGWYLQQFLKIDALIMNANQNSIIWDADCVPVKKLLFFNSYNIPLYMAAEEINDHYFRNIKLLLGLDRIQKQSFVIPGFPILKNWPLDFIAEIEQRNQKSWYDAILDSIDFKLKSGFSETETLGTWIANRHPNDWATTQLNWERSGQSKFGYAKHIKGDYLIGIGEKYNLDIVSFENWDLRGYHLKWQRLIELIKRLQINANNK